MLMVFPCCGAIPVGPRSVVELPPIARRSRRCGGRYRAVAGGTTNSPVMASVRLSVNLPTFGTFLGEDLHRVVEMARICGDAGVDEVTVSDPWVMGPDAPPSP